MKKILCYIVLIILLVLLLLPPVLRYFKEDYEEVKVAKVKDTVMVLNCSNSKEKINTSYLNGKTYNLQYQISGDYTLESDELMPIQEIITRYAKINYQQSLNVTDYKVDFSSFDTIPPELKEYAKELESQKDTYTSKGFTCSMNNY